MPREWRFGAPSAASPNRCAIAEPSGVPADVADAFVDRVPIDWAALLARVSASSDRALLESLRILDLVRSRTSPATVATTPLRALRAARAVLTLASVQTAWCLGGVCVALLAGNAAVRSSPALLALAFAAASLLLRAAAPRDRRRLFLMTAFVAAASAFARAAVTPPAEAGRFAFLLRGLYPESFAPAAVWQFAVTFPHVRRFTSFDLWARRAAAAAWLLGVGLFGSSLAAAYHVADWGIVSVLQRDHAGNAFWHLFAVAAVPAIAIIGVRSRRALPTERRKVARFAGAIAGGTAPFLLCGIARLLLPPVDQWFLTGRDAARVWVDLSIVGGLIATPILSTIAMVTDRPFEGHVVLRAMSRAGLAAAGSMLVTGTPIVALGFSLYRLRQVPVSDVLSRPDGWVAMTCAALAGGLLLTQGRLLEWVSCRLGSGVDPRERLAVALERLTAARGARETAVVLGRELGRGIGGASVQVLVPDGTGAFMDPCGGSARLEPDAALLALLRRVARPCDLSDGALLTLLPRQDREWVSASGARLATSLERSDGTVVAVILIGARRDGRPVNRRDRWLVATLTSAAAGGLDADDRQALGSGAGLVPARSSGRSGDVGFECRRCGVVADSPAPRCTCDADIVLASLPRSVGGKFIVERRLGAGGMGVVYVARDTALGRQVALKTLPAPRGSGAGRLRHEARAMAALNHDALATIYGLEIWRRTPVLVVEYFPAGTLADRLDRGPLPPGVAVAIGIHLARALEYMHAQGVLHRDLKPSNIGLTTSGTPKLLDFGLATLTRPSGPLDSRGRPGMFAGTPAYLPPEARHGASPAPAFDVWALSVVLLEAITGGNPFAASRADATGSDASEILARSTWRMQHHAPVLVPFFQQALACRPGSRLRTSGALRSALEAIAQQIPFE
jgi:Protein kinase domain